MKQGNVTTILDSRGKCRLSKDNIFKRKRLNHMNINPITHYDKGNNNNKYIPENKDIKALSGIGKLKSFKSSNKRGNAPYNNTMDKKKFDADFLYNNKNRIDLPQIKDDSTKNRRYQNREEYKYNNELFKYNNYQKNKDNNKSLAKSKKPTKIVRERTPVVSINLIDNKRDFKDLNDLIEINKRLGKICNEILKKNYNNSKDIPNEMINKIISMIKNNNLLGKQISENLIKGRITKEEQKRLASNNEKQQKTNKDIITAKSKNKSIKEKKKMEKITNKNKFNENEQKKARDYTISQDNNMKKKEIEKKNIKGIKSLVKVTNKKTEINKVKENTQKNAYDYDFIPPLKNKKISKNNIKINNFDNEKKYEEIKNQNEIECELKFDNFDNNDDHKITINEDYQNFIESQIHINNIDNNNIIEDNNVKDNNNKNITIDYKVFDNENKVKNEDNTMNNIENKSLIEGKKVNNNENKYIIENKESINENKDIIENCNVNEKLKENKEIVESDKVNEKEKVEETEKQKETEYESNTPEEEELEEESTNQKNHKKYGFANIGNNCYLNSSLQLLTRIVDLKENVLCFTDIITENATKGQLIKHFKKILTQIENAKDEDHLVINPTDLKYTMGYVDQRYFKNNQEDSNEFISNFIDALFWETSNKDKTEKIQKLNLVEEKDIKAYTNFDKKFYNRRGYSFILDLFYGVIRTQKYCKKCDKNNIISIKYNAYNMLELPIFDLAMQHKNKSLKFEDILKMYKDDKKTESICKNCNCDNEVYTKTSIYTFPKYLIISFGRSVEDVYIDNYITYPQELNLESDYDKSKHNFILESVIEHAGGVNYGHYTCLCPMDKNNTIWYKFSDSYYEESNNYFHSKNAIILLYTAN